MSLNINKNFLHNNNDYCTRNYALKISFQNEGILLLNILHVVDCSGHRYMDGICPPLCNIIEVFDLGGNIYFIWADLILPFLWTSKQRNKFSKIY